eukprot:1147041-Pelagomonas_calceolata.AAC.3
MASMVFTKNGVRTAQIVCMHTLDTDDDGVPRAINDGVLGLSSKGGLRSIGCDHTDLALLHWYLRLTITSMV